MHVPILLVVCLASVAHAQRPRFNENRLFAGVGAAAALNGPMFAGSVGYVHRWQPRGPTWGLAATAGVGGGGMSMLSVGPQLQAGVGVGVQYARADRAGDVAHGGLLDLSVTIAIVRLGVRAGYVGEALADIGIGLCFSLPVTGRAEPKTEARQPVYPACRRDAHCVGSYTRCVRNRCTGAR